VRTAFAIGASSIGGIDLGGRVVDVVAIPGHEASHVAFYDRRTRVLFTGDTLYPGRLYVQDFTAYRASVARLVAFTDDGHPVVYVLGGHIELSRTGNEFPAGSATHPSEHVLELGPAHLKDLLETVNAQGSTPSRTKRPDYVLVPL
jgi:glyoxylase-like metal-dependent hydrolase (beta-lactamase superfamily II)